jgi:hypothetical protein
MANKNVRVKNKVVKMAVDEGKVQIVLINMITKSKENAVPPLFCSCFLPSSSSRMVQCWKMCCSCDDRKRK